MENIQIHTCIVEDAAKTQPSQRVLFINLEFSSHCACECSCTESPARKPASTMAFRGQFPISLSEVSSYAFDDLYPVKVMTEAVRTPVNAR